MPKNANGRTWALPLRSNGQRFSRPPITPPTLSAVVDSSSQITVTASGATSTLGTIAGYRWRRNGVLLNGGAATASPLVSSGLSAATAYQFSATAVDSAGNESALSNVINATTASSGDTTAPTIPGSHNMSVINSTTLRSAWIASTDTGGSGLAGYLVERGPTIAGPFTQVTPVPVTSASYDHTGLVASTTYFARVRAVDNAGNTSGYSAISSATTAAQQSGAVQPALTVTYVDTAGELQVTPVSSGVTTITGVAPFAVHFDASGTRGVLSNNSTEEGAFHNIGYRLNYGEALGTTWAYPEGAGLPEDEDTGPPIFGRVFTTTGTKLVRLKCRDTNGAEATITLNVVVNAPAAPTIIEPTAGGWPAFVNGTHYGLRAGANYAAFGPLNTDQRHNLLFSKVGTGANPIIGQWNPDNTFAPDTDPAVFRPARNIRLQDITMASMGTRAVGWQFCAAVRCTLTAGMGDILGFVYSADGTTPNRRANIRRPRGYFLWKSTIGRMPDNYIFIMHARHWHMYGCDVNHSGDVGPTSSSAIVRAYGHESSFRYNRVSLASYSGISQIFTSMIGMQDIAYNPVTYSTDQWGQSATSAPIHQVYAKFVQVDCQWNRSGGAYPNAPGTVGGSLGNTSRLTGMENIRIFGNGPFALTGTIQVGGNNCFVRNVRYNMGAGAAVTTQQLTPSPYSATYDGPYVIETTSTRPVPTAF